MKNYWIGLIASLLVFATAPANAEQYIVSLDPTARSEPATGRVILFFITQQGPRWSQTDPMEGPFFIAPQPIASIAVNDLKPGDSITIDGSAPAFPAPLNTLSGTVRVQAVLDADQTERSHDAGPGNVFSDVMTVELSAEKDETIRISLTNRIEPKLRVDQPHLKWIRFKSEMLSEFYGRDVYHRAGVALPQNYDNADWHRQQWPAIYVIPGFGGRDDDAADYADMLQTQKVEDVGPIGVFIVLDPEAPLGHHLFADSANNGPRGTALVKEFIPYLESQFRLVQKPEARLVTGHSSGGWASLWLQVQYPETFGGCWSSAPDPIDMTAFQMTNIYGEANVFVDEEGNETPSFRRRMDRDPVQKTAMTVRQEIGMEQAIDPHGRSGQQWAAWMSVFSPRNPETGLPVPMFDPQTGEVQATIVRHWGKYDLCRVVQGRWRMIGDVILNKVRLACGEEDSYFLNRAVERFKAKVEEIRGEQQFGEGYILLVPGANHDTLGGKIFARWNAEMRGHLQKHGLQDADAPSKK